MTPHEVLRQLKSEGVQLKMRGNQLTGPRSMNAAQRLLIQRNKPGLIVALTYQCAVCDAPVNLFDREPKNYWMLECTVDPLHYSEMLKKLPGTFGLNVPLEEATALQEELGW